MFKALAPIIALVIAIGLGITYVKPTYDSVGVVKKEAAEYADAIEKANQLQMLLEEKMRVRDSFSPIDRNRLDVMLPNEIKEVAIVKDLDALARTHKLSITNVTVEAGEVATVPGRRSAGAAEEIAADSEAQNPKYYSTRSISLGLLGTYNDFRALVDDIEKSLVFFDVTNLKFSKSEGDLMVFDLTLRTYAFNGAQPQQ